MKADHETETAGARTRAGERVAAQKVIRLPAMLTFRQLPGADGENPQMELTMVSVHRIGSAERIGDLELCDKGCWHWTNLAAAELLPPYKTGAVGEGLENLADELVLAENRGIDLW